MPTKLQELHQTLLTETQACEAFIKAHVADDGSYKDTLTQEVADEFQKRQAGLAKIGEDYDRLRKVEDGVKSLQGRIVGLKTPYDPAPYPGHDGARLGRDGAEFQSLGRRTVDTPAWKSFEPGPNQAMGVEIEEIDLQAQAAHIKTLLTTGAGFAPANNRTDIVVPFAVRRPVVADLSPQDTTTIPVVTYMQQSTFTNNAAPVAEGATKPESALGWTPVSATVRKIAHAIPVTEEQLEDVDQARALIDNQLTVMLLLAEEDQLLNGNGTAPNLQGYLTTIGVQAQARGTDPTPDAVLKAFGLIRGTAGLGYAEPSGVIFNAADWINVRLTRTADGVYLWGPPSEMGPERIWGKPVIATTAMAQGTALTGDFATWSQILRRKGITIKAGWVNQQFIQNQQTILAEERLVLMIYRPAAFAKITGIPVGG